MVEIINREEWLIGHIISHVRCDIKMTRRQFTNFNKFTRKTTF
jgi:hypothetical protein